MTNDAALKTAQRRYDAENPFDLEEDIPRCPRCGTGEIIRLRNREVCADCREEFTNMNKPNPIICVDFDGVIHSYTSGWKGADVIPDEPVPGAIEWLIAHLPLPDALGMGGPYEGPEPVIYSARSSQRGGIRAMKEWFVKHGLSEWYIRDNILKFPETKPAAFLTIDDRAICFNGKFPTTEEMMGFQTWQKRDVAGQPVLGPTGQFPDGKLVFEDEGELRIGIAHDRDNVVINFGTPTAWIALLPERAKELATLIASHAAQV